MAAADPRFGAALRLRLAGKVDREILTAIRAAGLIDNVVSLGYCKHAEAVKEQRSASVLLLPLRNDPQYRPILPGKLFEYLAARRPVLGIGQVDGAMARVLAAAEAGCTIGWDDEEGLRAFLEAAWRTHCQGGIPATGLPGGRLAHPLPGGHSGNCGQHRPVFPPRYGPCLGAAA